MFHLDQRRSSQVIPCRFHEVHKNNAHRQTGVAAPVENSVERGGAICPIVRRRWRPIFVGLLDQLVVPNSPFFQHHRRLLFDHSSTPLVMQRLTFLFYRLGTALALPCPTLSSRAASNTHSCTSKFQNGRGGTIDGIIGGRRLRGRVIGRESPSHSFVGIRPGLDVVVKHFVEYARQHQWRTQVFEE